MNTKIKTHTLLSSVLATGAGTAAKPLGSNKVFHLTGFVSASTGAASVTVEGSLDGTNWVILDTLTLTLGVAVTSDSGVDTAPWLYVRGNVGSISGTDAKVTLTMALEV